MPKDPYDLGSNFDWSIIDNQQIPEDQKEAIKRAMVEEVKANQRGRTEAQTELARLRAEYDQLYGNYNSVATQAQKFEEWRRNNERYLNQWGDVVNAYERQQTAPQPTPQAAVIEHKRKRVTDRWDQGEISYEDMQRAMRDLDEENETLYGQIDQRFEQFNQQYAPVAQQIQRVQQELPRYGQTIGRLEQEIQRLRTEQQQGMGQLLPTTLEISKYISAHPDRDAEEIYRVWAEKQLPSWRDAAAELYGEEDHQAELEAYHQKKLAEAKEKGRRKQESRNLYSMDRQQPGQLPEAEPEPTAGYPGGEQDVLPDGNVGASWMRPKRREQLARREAAIHPQAPVPQQGAPAHPVYQPPDFNPGFRRTEGQVRDALQQHFLNPDADAA